MSELLKRVKLKGNESFNIREGWLRKGMRCVEENLKLFACDNAMEILGVGSKMVKSIRFWLQATGLTKEVIVDAGRGREQYLTDQFGKIIREYDPYFDDIFTLWLIHANIVANTEFCMPWHIFFNEFDGQSFRKEHMVDICLEQLQKKMAEGIAFSEKSFYDDCTSILKMYLSSDTSDDPEDSLECPLTELGLIRRSGKAQNTYSKTVPSIEKLDKLAVLYVITKALPPEKDSVSIDDLLNAPDNIGKVFNLGRVLVNEYLDQLRVLHYLSVTRTAGLDIVYIEHRLPLQDIMCAYYQKHE